MENGIKDLDEIFSSSIDDGNTEIKKNSSSQQVLYKDFKNINKKCISKAKKKINELLKKYLRGKDYKSDKYLRLKIEVDVEELSGLLYVHETSKWSITSLMEDIDQGSRNPRNYEVLASLQSKYLDVTKTLKGMVQILENDYKIYSQQNESEYTEEKKELLEEKTESVEYVLKARGQKDLIAKLNSMPSSYQGE